MGKNPATADTASSPTPYLQVRDLCKHYGEGEARTTVLHDVTTTVNKGEICVLPVSYTHLDVYKRQARPRS